MFETILIAIDGSPRSLNAAVSAAGLGLMEKAQRIELLGAIDIGAMSSYGLWPLGDDHIRSCEEVFERQQLEPLRGVLDDLTKGTVTTRMERGSIVEVIDSITEEEHFDLVVLGHRDPGLLKSWLGLQTSGQVARRSDVPVLIVPETLGRAEPIENLIVATDLSGAIDQALSVVEPLADSLDARLVLTHCSPPLAFFTQARTVDVWSTAEEVVKRRERYLERIRAELDSKVDEIKQRQLPASRVIRQEVPARGLLEECQDRKRSLLVVTSSASRNWFERLMAHSVLDELLDDCQQPLLVVPESHEASAVVSHASESQESSAPLWSPSLWTKL